MRTITRIFLIVPALFCLSCSNEVKTANKDEGVIDFDTKAVDVNNPLYSLAPSSAVLKFKKEKFAIEMNSFGMFKTAIIGNSKEKTLAQTVKFMDVKQVCIEDEKAVREGNKDFELKIEETSETKKIIGLNCYKAKVTKLSNPATSFDVWYTKDLGMEDCNSLTPYSQLKGVLIDYRVKKMGLEMHFLAKSFKNVAVEDNTFEISPGMKIVSAEEMARFFSSLQ
ncbi:MAG TPA: hypothetical protein PL029_10110 [Bacteroidia bacterium]|nr:hypothetical protein [Bacteroidia bacterium]